MADIQHSIPVEAPVATVYPLVSTGEGFSKWWAADVVKLQDDPEVAQLGFFNRSTIYRLRAEELKADQAARWRCETGEEWEGTHLTFTLQASGDKTLVRFTHGDWKAVTDYFIACNTTWGELMFRLKATAEGKSPGPLFSPNGMSAY
ncbi:MAG: SRPBCC family protein [Thermoanaerobaculia bacterium]